VPARIVVSKTQWILLFTCTSMFALGLGDNIRGPLFPDLIHFFQLSNTEASSSFAITSTFGFLGNLIAERILKKISIDRLLLLSLVIMAFALFGMGIAANFVLYMIAAAFFGLSMGLMGIAQNLMVAENVTGEMQTKALSGLHSIYGLSSLVAPFVASYAPGVLGFWRGGFFVTSAASVMVFAWSFIIHSREPIAHVNTPLNGVIKEKTKHNAYGFLMFGGILAFYVVTEILVSSRLALYMRQYFNMDLKSSSLYVTYFFSFLLLGRLGFTFKKFAASIKVQMNILLVLTFICVLLGLLAHPFFLALSGLTMAPFYPLGIAYLSEQTHIHKRRYITFAIALQNLCLISMHLGVGYLTDHFGLINAFGVGVISIVLSLLCINFHPRVST
jgi:MFS transporter, FHS family, glucose/mannose:H+ symporter